ncbi:MAG: hypothetical protein ACP5UT_00565 [Bryobacteraceae bacterium]
MVREGLSADEKRAIREELNRILASEFFRSTRRCREFLRFVVEKALEGEAHSLKERTIAVELFRKHHEADLERDSSVRVCARETRKRLADYYRTTEIRGPFRIELPLGGYVPVFLRDSGQTEIPHDGAGPATGPAIGALPARRRPGLRPVIAGVLPVLAAAALLLTASRGVSGPPDRFWGPAIHAPDGVEILIATPLGETASENSAGGPGAAGILASAQPRSARVSQASAAAEILHYFRRRNVRAEIGDYRQIRDENIPGKAIVILGESAFRGPHSWLEGCPVRLEWNERPPRFASQNGESWPSYTATGDETFAAIYRIPAADGHPFILLIAGLNAGSSEVAARFLVSPVRLATLLESAPPGWESSRMVLLLEIHSSGARPVRCLLW